MSEKQHHWSQGKCLYFSQIIRILIVIMLFILARSSGMLFYPLHMNWQDNPSENDARNICKSCNATDTNYNESLTFRFCPSNGNDPLTSVYKMTPRLQTSTSGPSYFFPELSQQYLPKFKYISGGGAMQGCSCWKKTIRKEVSAVLG